MIRLARQIRCGVIVGATILGREGAVAEVAPEHGRHAQLVGSLEGVRDFHDLALRLFRAKVDRGADRDCAHLERLIDRGEHDLVVAVRIAEELVVVELQHHRNAMRILAGDRAKHAQGRGDCVAAAFDRELDNVGRVEVVGIFSERGARRMLDALIDRQDREVAGAAEAPSVVHRLQIAQHWHRAITVAHDALYEIGAREVQTILVDRRAGVSKQIVGFIAEDLADSIDAHASHSCSLQYVWLQNTDSVEVRVLVPVGRGAAAQEAEVCVCRNLVPGAGWDQNRVARCHFALVAVEFHCGCALEDEVDLLGYRVVMAHGGGARG